jgi:hypothetical protein
MFHRKFVQTLLVSFFCCAVVSQTAHAQSAFFPGVIGPFEGVVTHTTPANFPDMAVRMAFFADGNFTEVHQAFQIGTPLGNVLVTPSLGSWIWVGWNKFKVSFAEDAEGGPGNPLYQGQPLGTNRIEWLATYDERTGKLSGPWTAKLFDGQGAFIAATQGDLRVTRMARPTP